MKFIKEFKEFISRGNVMDLAVGVVIGTAFTAIVNSLVNDIIMPIVGIITGGVDFSGLFFEIGGAKLTYGNFIGSVISFLLIALVVFFMVKFINKLRRPAPAKAVAPARLCPYCRMEIAEDATRCPHCTSIMTD